MSDKTEAAALVGTIRENMVEDQKVILETSEGQIRFEQTTSNYGSIFAVKDSYVSLKTNKVNEVLGAGIFQSFTDEDIIHRLVLVIRRMRIANKARAARAAAEA